MKKFYKFLMVAACVLCVQAVARAEGLYLHLQTSDGNWSVLSLDQADRLTFTGGQMRVTDPQGTQLAQFPAEALQSMTVNESPASIDRVDSDTDISQGFVLTDAGRVLTAQTDGMLRVYGATGALIVEIPTVKAGQTVDLRSLPAGAYVINFANVSRKALLK